MSTFDIAQRRRRALIQSLRLALQRVEEREQLTPDDPALLRLKQSLIRRLAELEIKDSRKNEPSAAGSRRWSGVSEP